MRFSSSSRERPGGRGDAPDAANDCRVRFRARAHGEGHVRAILQRTRTNVRDEHGQTAHRHGCRCRSPRQRQSHAVGRAPRSAPAWTTLIPKKKKTRDGTPEKKRESAARVVTLAAARARTGGTCRWKRPFPCRPCTSTRGAFSLACALFRGRTHTLACYLFHFGAVLITRLSLSLSRCRFHRASVSLSLSFSLSLSLCLSPSQHCSATRLRSTAQQLAFAALSRSLFRPLSTSETNRLEYSTVMWPRRSRGVVALLYKRRASD